MLLFFLINKHIRYYDNKHCLKTKTAHMYVCLYTNINSYTKGINNYTKHYCVIIQTNVSISYKSEHSSAYTLMWCVFSLWNVFIVRNFDFLVFRLICLFVSGIWCRHLILVVSFVLSSTWGFFRIKLCVMFSKILFDKQTHIYLLIIYYTYSNHFYISVCSMLWKI